jgi:hypothetical protein
MKNNVKSILKEFHDMNLATKLWWYLTPSQILTLKILEYIKVIEIDVIHMIGNVEDEDCFSTLSFMKNKLCNWVIDHLDLVVCIFLIKKSH